MPAPARRPAAGRAAPRAVPAENPHVVTAWIALAHQRTGPIVYPPSSKTIARRREKAEAIARDAATARQLAQQVQPGLRPPAGRLFAVDEAGLLLRGPAGGIGSTERMVRTLAPLAAGGRHAAAVLMVAGGWQDDQALCEALAGIGGKLAALGLRIDRRKAGIRMAKIKPGRAAS